MATIPRLVLATIRASSRPRLEEAKPARPEKAREQELVTAPDGRLLWRIHDVDYDLEPFVHSHPGGELAIRLGQGIDATALFESYHQSGAASGAARKVLEEHAIGVVTEPLARQTSAFKTDLDEMVRSHFRGQGKHAHKASWAHVLLCACLFAVELGCLVGWARGSWTASALLPVLFWLVAVNVSHDATHFAFSPRAWLNELAAITATPFMYEPITWYHQHVISHHTHCNEVAADVDLQHFKPLKLHPHDTRPHPAGHAGALDYLKVLLVGVHLSIWVPINASGLADDAGLPPEPYCAHFSPAIHTPAGLVRHSKYRRRGLVGPAVSLALGAYALGAHGVCRGLPLLLLPFGGVSLFFVLCTQVSHIQPEVQSAEAADEPDFFKRQATTSVDYATRSHLWRFLTGGLNTQALHHCLPYVSCCHFTDLYPAFALICARHGVKLHTRRSIFHAAATCAQHVWRINRGWGPPDSALKAGG